MKGKEMQRKKERKKGGRRAVHKVCGSFKVQYYRIF
jgi:hypothetical protein